MSARKDTIVKKFKNSKFSMEVRYTPRFTRIYTRYVVPEDLEFSKEDPSEPKKILAIDSAGTSKLKVQIELYKKLKPGTIITSYTNIVLTDSMIRHYKINAPIYFRRTSSKIAIDDGIFLRDKSVQMILESHHNNEFLFHPDIEYKTKG